MKGTGSWKSFDGELPDKVYDKQFSGNFIRVAGDLALTGALASGGRSRSRYRRGEIEIRQAMVFSLADLFFEVGEKYTAAELYEYFVACKVIATRRKRTPGGRRGQRDY